MGAFGQWQWVVFVWRSRGVAENSRCIPSKNVEPQRYYLWNAQFTKCVQIAGSLILYYPIFSTCILYSFFNMFSLLLIIIYQQKNNKKSGPTNKNYGWIRDQWVDIISVAENIIFTLYINSVPFKCVIKYRIFQWAEYIFSAPNILLTHYKNWSLENKMTNCKLYKKKNVTDVRFCI